VRFFHRKRSGWFRLVGHVYCVSRTVLDRPSVHVLFIRSGVCL
jgi:hypothetical protein